MKRIFPLVVILLMCYSITYSQHFQNFDFEVVDHENPLPKEWYIVEEKGCQFSVDTIAFSGKKSFLLIPDTTQSLCSATIINDLDKSLFKNSKKIKLIARVKSTGVNSTLSLIVKQLSESGQEIVKPPLFENFRTSKKVAWETLEYEREIDIATEHLAFGIKAFLKDSLWLDAFEIHIDGSKIVDSKPLKIHTPRASQLHWLNRNSFAIDSLDMNKFNFLDEDLGNTNIIALGEVTHGSSQVYNLKSLIIRYLVEKKNFSFLAMEMDMAEAEILNKYVLEGEGDPRALLLQTSYWPWQTEEFLRLLKWLNLFNSMHDKKIQITGFDLPISGLALDSIRVFASKHDQTLFKKTNFLKELRPHDSPEKIAAFIAEAEDISAYMSLKKDELINSSSFSEYDRVDYKLRSLKQAANFFSLQSTGKDYLYRDQCMAENISWLAKKNPSSRIVIWAHNAHISKGDYGVSMGKRLNEMHSFYSIGFSLAEGSFNASGQWGYRITPHPLNPPIQESYELFFKKSGKEMFFLNLKGLKRNKQNEWLFERRKLRYIGATSLSRYQFAQTSLLENFDGIIFINRSTPSHLIIRR